ncbi:S1 family peptidase [Halocatena salina]|uniref:S1 family peptidase n=1 Tax=Halocatena salina TaxID=2934340 RepID=A0A8U0A954_9EURY|nr:S1 family peptidase [Halocatena salina]UPM44543.1 S1 family peptidase [Halocatena salina]
MKKKGEKFHLMSRRRMMKSLATLGISGSALEYMSHEALAKTTDNPGDEIPRLYGVRTTNREEFLNGNASLKREPKYYTIPRDQWIRTETAFDAAKRIRKKFEDIDGIRVGVQANQSRRGNPDLEVSVSHRTVEGQSETRITPDIDFNELEDRIPPKAKGAVGQGKHKTTREQIPVVAKKKTLKEQAHYDSTYRPVPGGCEVVAGNAYGTIGTPAVDRTHNQQTLVTAGHVVNGGSVSSVYQPQGGSKIGSGGRGIANGTKDCGTIDLASGTSNRYKLADYYGDYKPEIVVGTLGRDRINDMASTADYLNLQGRTSGPASSYITAVDYYDIEVSYNLDGGDSGGPYYDFDGDYIYIAGIHAWGVGNNSRGNRMSVVESTLDVGV